MQSNGHRGSGSRLGNGAWLTPDEQTAALKRALEWRQEWRAEVAGQDTKSGRQAEPRPKRVPRKPDSSRAAFAAGIARAEFGRFYWDEKKHRLVGAERNPRPGK